MKMMTESESNQPKKASIKKRGRPPGKNRRPLKKWDPKRWEPVYDVMVLHSAKGKSNKWIAAETGYSEQQVSNILTSEKGILAKAEIIKNIRTKIAETFDNRAEQIADLTMSRVHQLLTDDEKFRDKPFAVIDRGLAAARTLLPEKNAKSGANGSDPLTQAGQPSVTNIQQNNITVFSREQLDHLTGGLARLEEVKKLHNNQNNNVIPANKPEQK